MSDKKNSVSRIPFDVCMHRSSTSTHSASPKRPQFHTRSTLTHSCMHTHTITEMLIGMCRTPTCQSVSAGLPCSSGTVSSRCSEPQCSHVDSADGGPTATDTQCVKQSNHNNWLMLERHKYM